MQGCTALREKTDDCMGSERRVALWVNQEEADAVMSVLLEAPPSVEVPGELTELLLRRIAEVQRQFAREAAREASRLNAKMELASEIPARRRLYIRRTGRTQRVVRLR
jgi:hypothetical protein